MVCVCVRARVLVPCGGTARTRMHARCERERSGVAVAFGVAACLRIFVGFSLLRAGRFVALQQHLVYQ